MEKKKIGKKKKKVANQFCFLIEKGDSEFFEKRWKLFLLFALEKGYRTRTLYVVFCYVRLFFSDKTNADITKADI